MKIVLGILVTFFGFFCSVQAREASPCEEMSPAPPQNYGNYDLANFKKLNDVSLASYLDEYEKLNGHKFSEKNFRPDIYNQGFFIHRSGIFVTALHVVGDVVRYQLKPGQTYLAGRDGPPIGLGTVELYYVGHASQVYDSKYGFRFPYGCFDCLNFSDRDEIVIGKVLQGLPNDLKILEIATEYPRLGETVFAAGKPHVFQSIPKGEVRATLGRVEAVRNRSLVISNYLAPGFSGGPILNASGKVIATSVTIVNHFDKISNEHPTLLLKRPSCWEETWGIGSELVSIKSIIDMIITQYSK